MKQFRTNRYLLVLHLATNKRKDLTNKSVDILRNHYRDIFFEHHPDAVDHFVGAMAVIDNALKRNARFRQVGFRIPQPAQAGIGICGNGCQRLFDFMSDGCCHLAHRHPLPDARQIGPRQAQRIAIADIAKATDKNDAPLIQNRRNRKLEGKFVAVLFDAGHLRPPAQNLAFAGLQITANSAFVSFPVSLRNDQVGHRLSECFVPRPAKNIGGAIVPLSNDAVGRHHNDRIQSGFQQQAEPIAVSRGARKVPFQIGNV